MQKLFDVKYRELLFYSIAFFLNLLFTIILYSLELTSTGLSIWSTMGYSTIEGSIFDSYTSTMSYVGIVCIILFVLFLLGVILSSGSLALYVLKKKRWGFYIAIFFQFALNITIVILHVIQHMLSSGAFVLVLLNFIVMALALLLTIYFKVKSQAKKNEDKETKRDRRFKIGMIILESLSMLLVLFLFFVPLFSKREEYVGYKAYVLYNIFGINTYELYASIAFILLMLIIFVCFLYFISTISYFSKRDKSFSIKAKASIYSNVGVTLLFFLMGYFICFYQGIKKVDAYTLSYIPFVLSLGILIIFSIFEGRYNWDLKDVKIKAKDKAFKFEPLLYVFMLTLLTLLTLVVNVVDLQVSFTILLDRSISLSGYELLTTYQELGGGFQLLSFILFSFLVISGILLVVSISSFFAKYKDYYKVVKVTVIANVLFVLLLGLFGLYFKIAQKINEETLKSLLETLQISLEDYSYSYKVSSQTIYLFIGSFIILLIMIFRGQLNHQIADETILKLSKDSDVPSKGQQGGFSTDSARIEFDACPAFTEFDSKLESYKEELERRRQQTFSNLTLPTLVRFIVDYARECRLHLSYSLEDIATFVAGLGASRLTILQGMSGTGKTSLPKIFAEAIFGNCEIVEVESSWRDKNELLGYYNEFSKCYTPKKFTQCLYKARLNAEIPTFIVLDEMNLSRIEYYFSDFLSLMEHEENKREIKLLNIKLARIVEGNSYEYYGLTDGHTIKIPTNIWFIGTANRDESTFEISDKVYDRAQTMNFNKRAPKIHSFSEPLDQKFVTYAQLSDLFEIAKMTYSFEAEENKIIQRVEKLLAPYNISFGNRILKQMEDFVKIYCACFGDKNAVLNDAVEKILLSKVVSKLEFKIVENKEALALEFDKLGLTLCSAFVRKLNED